MRSVCGHFRYVGQGPVFVLPGLIPHCRGVLVRRSNLYSNASEPASSRPEKPASVQAVEGAEANQSRVVTASDRAITPTTMARVFRWTGRILRFFRMQ